MESYHQSIAKRTPRFLFTRDSITSLPSTYEQVYNSCRYVVSVAKDGATLHTIIKMEIQQCVDKLARELTSSKEGVQWLPKFVEICEWYETQVVRTKSRHICGVDADDSTGNTAVPVFMSRSDICCETERASGYWVCTVIYVFF